MKQGPIEYYADDLKNWSVSTTAQHPEKGEVWVAARPLSASWSGSIFNRLRMAWIVFTGNGDVLRWHQQ